MKILRTIAILVCAAAGAWALVARVTDAAAPAAFLLAPRGVSASDDDHIDKIAVIWHAVPGASAYRIFRSPSTDPASLTDVGTTAAPYFFDFSAAVGVDYLYRVRAENASATSDPSAADGGRRAPGNFDSPIFSALSAPPAPAANSVTASKAALGKTLFWDEQLSSTWTVSCGTCHRPAAGGSDPRTALAGDRARNPGPDNVFGNADDVFGSPGVIRNNADGTYSPSPLFGFNEQVTPRKAPSYLNVGITTNGTFWDGRATNTFRDPLTNTVLINDWGGLENQSLGPPLNAFEMAHGARTLEEAAAQIAAVRPLALADRIPSSMLFWINGRSYPQLFAEAFGTPDVTPARIAMALATHERTLFSDRTPLDRWASANGSLTAEEDRGRIVFQNVNCVFCHGGPVLSDQNFHNIGVRPQADDPGRGGVTGNTGDMGRFKTPTLRNVELRAPYFHNGRFATLEEVVEFYNRGGDFNAANINRGLIRQLNLTAQQKSDLVAFMRRPMTDPRVAAERAPFDRPRLFSESSRVPSIEGAGRAGTGGTVPRIVAVEPPVSGNPSFTVGVSQALGNAQAVIVIDDADPEAGASIPSGGSFVRQAFTLDAGGFGSASISIPADPALEGRELFGRVYVNDAGAANGFAVSRVLRFRIFAPAAAVRRPVRADFDGDGKSDIAVRRPANGQWWIERSGSGSVVAESFGNAGDLQSTGDFTGDGRTDPVLFRPATGEWFVLRSEDSTYFSFPFGVAGDVPAAGDYDGDGLTDAAVFRVSNSTWYVRQSSGGFRISQFGALGDDPVTADFDGDGRDDIAVFRPATGEWWIRQSSEGVRVVRFGTTGDVPLPADFTGDGRADVAVWRPASGEWFVLRSEDFSFYAFPFGSAGDIPVRGDYDGDGRSDAAVFRAAAGTWYVNRSGGGLTIRRFGLATDEPVGE